jgi:hypothetical protein
VKRIAWVALLGLALVGRAHGALALAGYFQAQNVTRFVVVDRDTGERSPWLFVGDLYQGYMVMGFESGAEVLILERENNTVRLPLGAPRARTELRLNIAPNGTLTLAGETITVAELERRFRSMRGSAVGFEVRTQPGVDAWETLNSIVAMLRDSAANQWSIRVIDTTTARKTSAVDTAE